jgi:ribonucrease Y
MEPYVIGLAIGALVAILATILIYSIWLRPIQDSAEDELKEARAAKQKAEDDAERLRKEVLAEAKAEGARIREEAAEEIRSKQQAMQRLEEKLDNREEGIEARRHQLDERERAILSEQRGLTDKALELQNRELGIEKELQRISGLNREKARELYVSRLEAEFREAGLRRAREVENQTAAQAEAKAKRAVLDAIQRSAVDYVTEATVSVVGLPSEDMKGRIIGREGRNIRAFEQVAGVDLIIDDTPEAVVISCFDPVRREVARQALVELMNDGRIHPVRIEEIYEKAEESVNKMIRDAGEQAVDQANVTDVSPRVIEMLGRLRFRTSYAQNVLDHSVEVSRLASVLAAELGFNIEVAKRAGLLHDIGKALGPEWEGPHALTGMEFLRGHGEKDPVLHAVGAHHYEIEPQTGEAILVIIADGISAVRPGARRESLENYVKRLSALEQLAASFPGVERSYAVQAGREIRLMVKPNEIDDLEAARLANDVAKRIESELEYPGQIKVTVIRETRAQGMAR